MQEQRTSPRARLFAVGSLIVVFITAIAIAATTTGSDNGADEPPRESGGDITRAQPSKQSRDIRTALDRGEYIVEPGDSMTSIAEETGIDLETLEQLNPGIDPQALPEGARIRLR